MLTSLAEREAASALQILPIWLAFRLPPLAPRGRCLPIDLTRSWPGNKIVAQERNLFFIKRRGPEHLDFSQGV